MTMNVYTITVPNPYKGQGSKSAERKAPMGWPTLSYFTVFAKDLEDARLLFVDYCERGARVPTGTDIIEVGTDPRVRSRKVINHTPQIVNAVDIVSVTTETAKEILAEYLNSDDLDPTVSIALQTLLKSNNDLREVMNIRTTKEQEAEVIEVPIEELMQDQALADEVSDDINQRLSFFDRLTKKRGE